MEFTFIGYFIGEFHRITDIEWGHDWKCMY